MSLDPTVLADFRRQVMAARTARGELWEASRRLVSQSLLSATRQRLCEAMMASNWPIAVKEAVTQALGAAHVTQPKDLSGKLLKQLTGLPPTKALRALCLLFDLVPGEVPAALHPTLSPEAVEDLVRKQDNPFDLLFASPDPSLLDLGAGDLTFADQVAAQYGPPLAARGSRLVLHCLDRLDPKSRLGGPLHPEASRLARLCADPHLHFRYIGDQDMFDLGELDRTHVLSPRYSIVTCWAPATPTFAYEPSRLAASIIEADLRRTKGEFRSVRVERERALEVRHQDRVLLFPPWKFDIRGPLALLQLMASRGSLCLLGAVDAQVFWEVLAQLVEDPRMRPSDRLFTEQTLSEVFGDLYRHLSQLPIGQAIDLADITELRHSIPLMSDTAPNHIPHVRFRHVRVRRGAVFHGMPASSTAGMFRHMTEEAPPWFVALVPEMVAIASS